MKLLDLIYLITFKQFSNYISIELQLVYDWINCFSLPRLNSFIDDEFLIFNGILFQVSIILFQW